MHVCVCVCALTGGGTCSACMVFSNGVKDKGWVLHAPPLVSSKVTLQCAFESLCGYELKQVLTVYLGIICILFCVCAPLSLCVCTAWKRLSHKQSQIPECIDGECSALERLQVGATETAETERGCSRRTNYTQMLYKKCSGKTVA